MINIRDGGDIFCLFVLGNKQPPNVLLRAPPLNTFTFGVLWRTSSETPDSTHNYPIRNTNFIQRERNRVLNQVVKITIPKRHSLSSSQRRTVPEKNSSARLVPEKNRCAQHVPEKKNVPCAQHVPEKKNVPCAQRRRTFRVPREEERSVCSARLVPEKNR